MSISSGMSRRKAIASMLTACSLPSLLRAADNIQPTKSCADVPWLDEVQRPPKDAPKDAPQLRSLLVDADGNKITTLEAWRRRRQALRRWWIDFLKTLEVEQKRTPSLTVVKEDRPEGVIRQLVRYEAEPGEMNEAYLLKPAAAKGRRPAVVALHSSLNQSIRQPAGVDLGNKQEEPFGLGLARRGYVTFCPRNYLWSGGNPVARFAGRHPGSKGMAKMLLDGVVALNILTSLPDVDPLRLGAVGHSLGGKEVLYLAALDERVRAAASSEGGIGTKYSNWDAPWYLGEDIRRADFGHEHHELLALVAPRPFLLVGGGQADGPRSWPFIEAALPVYRLYGGMPRLGLYDHERGHNVLPEAADRIYQWFNAYCGEKT